MDLRHGVGQTWRRSSPAPASVRTCTPASAVTTFLWRLTPRRRPVKECMTARCAVAIDNISQPAAAVGPLLFESHDGSVSQVSCMADAPCPAVLQTRLSKAHSSAASAALVVQDTPDEKLVATASLDKGMAIWRFYSSHMECENADGSCEESIEVTRLKVPGAPVFSLAKIPEVLPDGTILRKRPKPPGVYLGTAAKEVLTWMLGSKDVTDKVVLDGHTGWVRSLAITGKWLFSCGCNYLRLWDTTFRTPKECETVRLFTGDILAIAASDGRVYTAGADGSLRSWAISRAGALQEGPHRERAHEGRVSACLISGSRVFTVSYDGSVKAWDSDSLELVAEVKGAHNGEKIFCVAVGSNGVVFTGGDDKLVRAWDQDLNPIGAPLDGHGASVRVLSAGNRALLVSGDADGDVCIWETYPVNISSTAKSTTKSSRAADLEQLMDPVVGFSAAAPERGVPVPPGAAEAAIAEVAAMQLEVQPAAAESSCPHELAAASGYYAADAGADAQMPSAPEHQQQAHAPEHSPGTTIEPPLETCEPERVAGTAAQQQEQTYAPVQSLGFFDEQHQRIYEPEQNSETVHAEHHQIDAWGQSSGAGDKQQNYAPEQTLGFFDEQHQRIYEPEQVLGASDAVEQHQQLEQWQAPSPGQNSPRVGELQQLERPGTGCSGVDQQGYSAPGASTARDVCEKEPHVALLVDGAAVPFGDDANGRTAYEEQVAAAPAVHANGSGGFAVLAVTVSEDNLEEDLPRTTAEVVVASPVRHIEVESVAAAVAAACLPRT